MSWKARDPVRIGVIGLGRMGQNHVRVLSLLAAADLRFAFDVDQDVARGFSETAGIAPVTDLDSALDGVDAVVIASPTTTHEAYIRQAAGKVRHIFVEKPVTEHLSTSIAVADFAAQAGLHVQVGFIERFNPAVRQMKAMLDASAQVVSVDFTRTNKISARITDVDVVTDLMIHDIDLALHLNGPAVDVSAHGVAEGPMIDYAAALLTHRNGRFSRIQASRITDKRMRSIQATCKDMFVDCDLLAKEIMVSRHSGLDQRPGESYRIAAVQEQVEVQPREALQLELIAFLDACHDGPGPEVPSLAEAVAAMEVCERVLGDILQSSV